jgi:hypothetical protein
MAKLTVSITGKVRSCLFLLAALREQGPKVTQIVIDLLRPSLEPDEEPPPFLAQLQALGRLLRAALELMIALDRKLYDEEEQRAILFAERQVLVSELGRKVSGLRRIVIGHYPDAKAEKLGLQGRTEQEPIALLRQSELVCQKLRREDREKMLGDPLFDLPLDPEPYVLQIDPVLARLTEALRGPPAGAAPGRQSAGREEGGGGRLRSRLPAGGTPVRGPLPSGREERAGRQGAAVAHPPG